jgi:hypothetical protein
MNSMTDGLSISATAALSMILLASCTTHSPDPFALSEMPATDTYCLEAQRVVTRTTVPMKLVVHDDFDAFVKSKAVIEGPTIHQFNWYSPAGSIQGYSCKMKSADHLNIEFGDGTAGPDGYCHDMNMQVYELLQAQSPDSRFTEVIFDYSERLDTKEQASMIGPTWLKPFTMTYVDTDGNLHVATKGFVINFADPRYQKFPASWRGTHYCHLIAPDYLADLLRNKAEADAVIGGEPKRLRMPEETDG